MTFTATIVHRIADLAAWAVASRRELVQHALTIDECEAQGLPEGSTERAVEVVHLGGLPWWRAALWVDADYSVEERCLNVNVLRHRIEVFYRPERVSVPV